MIATPRGSKALLLAALVLAGLALIGLSFVRDRAPGSEVATRGERLRGAPVVPGVELAHVEGKQVEAGPMDAPELAQDRSLRVPGAVREEAVAIAELDEEEPAPLAFRARIVDLAGRPVSDAEGSVALHVAATGEIWDWRNFTSARDGTVEEFGEIEGGWISAVAHHPSYGVGTTEVLHETSASGVDLGDIVLVERGVIAGEIRGLSGRPLPRLDVEAIPREQRDRFDSVWVMTDEVGRFRFANLEAVPYEITTEFSEKPARSTPNAHGVILDLDVRSAAVTVVGRDREPIEEAELSCRLLNGNEERFPLRLRPLGTGRYELALPADPTHVLVTAKAVLPGRRWSGRVEFETVQPDMSVELVLSPDEAANVHFSVIRPNGAKVHRFHATICGAPSDRAQGEVELFEPNAWLDPGRWRARVSFHADDESVQFVSEFEVRPRIVAVEQRVFFLAPPTDSGVEVDVRASSDESDDVRIEVRESAGDLVAATNLWLFRSEPFIRHLAPGQYTVAVLRSETEPPALERSVVVTAGEFTRVELTLPGS
ncbi:MAG: carboxypeptidase-like regulatory domain-containing protein [Planctomycetota bacterium]